MEKRMTKYLKFAVPLLFVLLLTSLPSSAASNGFTASGTPQPALATSAVQPVQVLTMFASSALLDRDDWWHHDRDGDGDRSWNRHDHDRDGDGDHDGDGKKKGHGPEPTPEPSTILSFGAALLIGGGVLYSRRLRATRK
jgi:hypothetical protein